MVRERLCYGSPMLFIPKRAVGPGAVVLLAMVVGSGCGLFIPTLGSSVPAARWLNPADNSVGDKFSGIAFWTDTRNNCAENAARNEFGDSALLSLRLPATVTDDMVLPWVTNLDVNSGKVQPPFAVFAKDSLSGLKLQLTTGTVTVVRHPVAGGYPNFVVALKSDDGKVNSTFVAPPLCP